MIDANRLERGAWLGAPGRTTYKVRTALVAPDGRHHPAGSYFTVEEGVAAPRPGQGGGLLLVSSAFGEFQLVRDQAPLPEGREVLGRVVAVDPPRGRRP